MTDWNESEARNLLIMGAFERMDKQMTKPQFYLQAASGVMNPIDPGYDVSSIDPENVWVHYADHKAEIEREYNRGFARGSGDEGAYQREIARLRAENVRLQAALDAETPAIVPYSPGEP